MNFFKREPVVCVGALLVVIQTTSAVLETHPSPNITAINSVLIALGAVIARDYVTPVKPPVKTDVTDPVPGQLPHPSTLPPIPGTTFPTPTATTENGDE